MIFMAYPDNPMNTARGQRILQDIFDLIYLKNPTGKPNNSDYLAQQPGQMPEVVSNFKGNAGRIVMLMRRFLTGNTHVGRQDTGSSGIHVCNPFPAGWFGGSTADRTKMQSKPRGCGRRDFIWWWEFTDFGVYNSTQDWGSSVGMENWESGFWDPTYAGRRKQVVVARAKCNTVNTCTVEQGGCGTTWRGNGACPNPLCNSKQKVTVGCGAEQYMIFALDLRYTLSSYWPQTGQYRNGASIPGAANEIPPNRLITVKGGRGVEDEAANKSMFRFYWQGLPKENRYLSTPDQCFAHIPYFQMGYTSNSDARNKRPGGYTCNSCGEHRRAPKYGSGSGEFWGTNFDIVARPTFFNESDYPGDQRQGLCKNIGDRQATYAGISGMFGCECGGIFEPEMKIPAFPDRLKMIYDEFKAAELADIMSQQSSTYARVGSNITQGDQGIYYRGAIKEENRNQVREKYTAFEIDEAQNFATQLEELQAARYKNAFPCSIPLTQCRQAFTYEVLKICKNPIHKEIRWSMPGTGINNQDDFQPLIDREGNFIDYCPTCGADGDPSYIYPHPSGLLTPPMLYHIVNSQPLKNNVQSPMMPSDSSGINPDGSVNEQSYGGKAQWSIVMKSPSDKTERFNKRIELPQVYMGDIVPYSFNPQSQPPPGGGREPPSFTCPNEDGILEFEQQWLQNNTTTDNNEPQNEDELEDNQVLTTATYNLGDTVLSVTPANRVQIGDYINGPGIELATSVVAINEAGNQITLSAGVVAGAPQISNTVGGQREAQTSFASPQVLTRIANPTNNPDTNSDFTGIPYSGTRNNNYRFVVTEGKSAMCWVEAGVGWADASPLVRYADGTEGPRWTKVPGYEFSKSSGSFQVVSQPERILNASMAWMISNQKPNDYEYDSETGYDFCWLSGNQISAQIAQDMQGNVNRSLKDIVRGRVGGSRWRKDGTHILEMVDELEAPQSGLVDRYYICRTCEAISEIGSAAENRGTASNLIEALQNDTYYPGYAAIRYYQSLSALRSDASLINTENNTLSMTPSRSSTLTEGYLEGAVEHERKTTQDVLTSQEQGNTEVTIPPGWRQWLLRFRANSLQGGDYKF